SYSTRIRALSRTRRTGASLRFFFLIFLYSSAAPRDLHSFPTRRSSDLHRIVHRLRLVVIVDGVGDCWMQALRTGVKSADDALQLDRKSTRLNSSHGSISYAVFCLKKKKKGTRAAGRRDRTTAALRRTPA